MLLEAKFILGIIAGCISFSAYLVYFYSIIKGESKPSRVTWLIWTFMGAIGALSYYFSGARDTIWSPIVEFIGPLITAILAIKYGEGGIEDLTDVICFIGGVISILLWIIFKNPVIALLMTLVIDGFAIVPTIKKSFYRPDGENLLAWVGTACGDFLNLLAVEKPVFAIIIYPVWMVTVDLCVIGARLLGNSRKR